MDIGMTSIIKSVVSQARKQGDALASIIYKIDLVYLISDSGKI